MKFPIQPRKNLLTICMIVIGSSLIYFSFANKERILNFHIATYSGTTDSLLPNVKVELSNAVNKYTFFTNSTAYNSSWVAPGKYYITLSKPEFLTTADSVVVSYKTSLYIKMFIDKKAIISFENPTDMNKDSLGRTMIEEKSLNRDGAGKYTAGERTTDGESLTLKSISIPHATIDRKTESADYYRKADIAPASKTSYDLDDTKKKRIKGEMGKTILLETPDAPNNIKAGMLTAGEVNDFSKWNMWNDIAEGDLKTHTTVWQMQPKNRYTVQVSNKDNFPVVNATVKLFDKKGNTIWTALTDQTGKAELWAELYNIAQQSNNISCNISVSIKDNVTNIKDAKPFKQGINFIKVSAECSKADTVDIAWVVDATGSMGDEISYLKAELSDVMQKAKANHPDLNFRLGSVFYRDYTDSYLTQTSQLSSDITQTVNFVKNQNAGGGGDFPEAVDTALSVAMNSLNWSKNARTKLLFLVLDAPPHANLADIERVKKVIEKAAKLGIHIIPVASSGIDKSTEYLMRCLALTTNGTYVFLTDDSGIGGSHIKPTTDEYKVETLNGLLLRLIDQYTLMVSCSKQLPDTFKQVKDTIQVLNKFNPKDTAKNDSIQFTQNLQKDTIAVDPHLKFTNWKYYPNPTTGPLTVDIEGQINELFLTDFGGKILIRLQPGNERTFNLNLEQYPSGVYFLRYYYNDKVLDGRVVLLH